MNERRLEFGFFICLLAIVIFLSFLVLRPYLDVIVLAVALTLIFEPLYRLVFLKIFRYPTLAALGVTITITIIVFIPLGFFAIWVFGEVSTLYASLASNGGFDFGPAINHFVQSNFSGLPLPTITINFNDFISEGLTWFLQNLGSLFSSVAQAFFVAFLSLLGLFFFLKDGAQWKEQVLKLLPLEPKYAREIINELESVVSSVIKGTLVVAVIQGLVAGTGFFLFNIPNPAFWGSLVMISSLIPIVGTWLVVAPAVAYLFFTGQTILAVSLLVWSVILVNFIYNVLSPQLMHRGNHIHPFAILLSVLGGISIFGPIGFILGPFVIALLISLSHIYPKLIKSPLNTRA